MTKSLWFLPLCLLCTSDSSSTETLASSPLAEVADSGNALPSAAGMQRLARTDPIAFLENCIRRYDREVKGYTTTLVKQERIKAELKPSEVIDVAFREDPFSVLMKWKQNPGRAAAVLFVKGENDDKLLVRPAGLLSVAGIVKRDPRGSDAREASRYPLTEFGIKIGMQRTLASWKKADKDKTLHVEYLGVKKIKEAGDRPCWVLKRTSRDKPEGKDGVAELTLFIDKDTWLQVGSILKDEDGKTIASYFFRDLKLNPDFPADAFSRDALKR